jgi:hypothetical protein
MIVRGLFTFLLSRPLWIRLVLSNSDAKSFPKGFRQWDSLMVFVFNTALYHPNTFTKSVRAKIIAASI